MGPTCGPSGADRSQVDPMLAPWTLLSGTLRTYDTLANLLRYQLRPDWVLSYGDILMSKTSRLIYYLPHLWYISLTQIQSSIGSVQSKMQPYVYAHRNRYDSLGMCTAKQEHGNKMFHNFRFLWDFAFCHVIDSERHSTMLMLFRSLWSVYLVRLYFMSDIYIYIYIYDPNPMKHRLSTKLPIQFTVKMQPCIYAHRNRYDSLGLFTVKQEHGSKTFRHYHFFWDFTFVPYNTYGTVVNHVTALHVPMVCVLSLYL